MKHRSLAVAVTLAAIVAGSASLAGQTAPPMGSPSGAAAAARAAYAEAPPPPQG